MVRKVAEAKHRPQLAQLYRFHKILQLHAQLCAWRDCHLDCPASPRPAAVDHDPGGGAQGWDGHGTVTQAQNRLGENSGLSPFSPPATSIDSNRPTINKQTERNPKNPICQKGRPCPLAMLHIRSLLYAHIAQHPLYACQEGVRKCVSATFAGT